MPTRIDWPEAEARAALAEFDPVVRRLARALARSASRCDAALDADDLASEGRVAVLEALSSFSGGSRRARVRTRVKHRMLDAIRRASVYTRDETEARKRAHENVRRVVYVGDRGWWVPDPRPAPDELVALKECAEHATAAMKELPPRQREALEAGFPDEDLSVTGARMGITESRVCQLQKQAARNLCATLAEAPMPTPITPLPPDEQLRREYESGAGVIDLVYRHHASHDRIRAALYRAGTVWRTKEQTRALQADRNIETRRKAREARGHGRPPAKASSRSAGSTPAVAPTLALEERQAMVTEFRAELAPEMTLAAVTVSAMSIVADAFGDVLGIGAEDRSEIATMRERLEGGDRDVRVIGSPALNRVARALKLRHPDAYRRLTLLCERVA